MNSKPIQIALKNKIDKKIFSGCSLIFGKPNQKLLEIHEGNISFSDIKRISSETSFDLQSITKAVATGPLTLKLIESGKIKLDDVIGPYLRELGVENSNLEEIKFGDLLTHSSGLSDGDLAGDFKSPAELWKHMLNAKPQFNSGSAIEYTDLGYRILGKVLEQTVETNLEVAAREMIWKPMGLKTISYLPKNVLNIAATPDAHGVIDDEQVHFLGGVLGCDGVFSNANDLFQLMSMTLTKNKNEIELLQKSRRSFEKPYESFFDTLAFGEKAAGWEVNVPSFTYAGKFHSRNTFEKAGGAGTFVWFDLDSQYIFVYLTNYGKPKPFDDQTWNQLLERIGPMEISNLIYENL